MFYNRVVVEEILLIIWCNFISVMDIIIKVYSNSKIRLC